MVADGLLTEVGFMVRCCLMGRKFAYFMQIWTQVKLIRLSLVSHYLHARPSSPESELMKRCERDVCRANTSQVRLGACD